MTSVTYQLFFIVSYFRCRCATLFLRMEWVGAHTADTWARVIIMCCCCCLCPVFLNMMCPMLNDSHIKIESVSEWLSHSRHTHTYSLLKIICSRYYSLYIYTNILINLSAWPWIVCYFFIYQLFFFLPMSAIFAIRSIWLFV